MKRYLKPILFVVGICLAIAVLIYGIMFMIHFNDENRGNSNREILYSTTYYFEFGSRSIIIYENGDVYDDTEVEDPYHEPDYKYFKTLTNEEVNSLIKRLKDDTSSESIQDYVIQLVYGVEEFDNFGNY